MSFFVIIRQLLIRENPNHRPSGGGDKTVAMASVSEIDEGRPMAGMFASAHASHIASLDVLNRALNL